MLSLCLKWNKIKEEDNKEVWTDKNDKDDVDESLNADEVNIWFLRYNWFLLEFSKQI